MVASRKTSGSPFILAQPGTVLAACLIGLIGAGLLWSGSARWTAETAALFAGPTVRDLNAGRPVDQGALRTAIQSTGKLAALDGTAQSRRAVWTLFLGTQSEGTDRDDILRLGTRWLIQGLQAAPLDGAFWTALSESLWLQDHNPRVQSEALRLGFLLGPRRLNYNDDRLAMALALADRLDNDLMERVERDIAQLWDVPSRRALLIDLAEQPVGRAWIDRAFADRPDIARDLRLTAAVRATDLVSQSGERADVDEP